MVPKIVTRIRNYISRNLMKYRRLLEANGIGVKFIEPNFIYIPVFSTSPVVVDVGCGYEADFSKYMIENHNALAFCIDPTKKHAPLLKKLEEKYVGNLKYLQYAISDTDNELTFYESQNNESGSIFNNHVNILNDKIIKYKVKALSIPSLKSLIDQEHIELLKLDIEGAEYSMFNNFDFKALEGVSQLFIEFHHQQIEHRSQNETFEIVRKIEGAGFNSFSIDDVNFLFYRKEILMA
tara:strand:- start:21408 stop:22118 length:711 start_codon:yes stop_codon:yes gene_type:complete